jgi:hypothetical protein
MSDKSVEKGNTEKEPKNNPIGMPHHQNEQPANACPPYAHSKPPVCTSGILPPPHGHGNRGYPYPPPHPHQHGHPHPSMYIPPPPGYYPYPPPYNHTQYSMPAPSTGKEKEKNGDSSEKKKSSTKIYIRKHPGKKWTSQEVCCLRYIFVDSSILLILVSCTVYVIHLFNRRVTDFPTCCWIG